MTESARRILVVEDERTIADILADYLQRAGYCADIIENGLLALEAIRTHPPDRVVLDIMLPGMDGMTVCREVRRFSTVPIIMVTARVEELDRLLGLEVGADDYVCKPFSPREVVARVATVLRRVGVRPETAGRQGIEIDDGAQRISFHGQRLDLTPTEYRLLALLASRPGRIYSRAQILDLAYGDSQDVADRIIDSHIKNIRRKIAAVAPDTEIIQSVYGVGYRFEI